jgi:uncharacterized protein YaiE (UPF0345 family)
MSDAVPSEFKNVTTICKANVYFDGKVASHTLLFADGSKKTLGLIYPGEYHFGTGVPEKMEIVAGACRVKLDGSDAWQAYSAGSCFRVPGQSGFSITVAGDIAEYICSYE